MRRSLYGQSVEHVENHFTATAAVRDIVIGMSDGLTVPFALAAGLTGAVASHGDRRYRGICGNCRRLDRDGAWRISGRQDRFRALCFASASAKFARRSSSPMSKPKKWPKFFATTGFRKLRWQPIVTAITSDQNRWVDFMMRFELGLEEPDPARAGRSAGTIAISYIVGRLDSAGALHPDEAGHSALLGFGRRDACWRCSSSARSKVITPE